MSENALRVDHVMTPMPLTISPDAPIDEARRVMMAYGISHLPVLSGGELEGLVSRQDMLTASAVYGSSGVSVRYAMTTDPLTVGSDEPFAEVLGTMIDRKIPSVVVRNATGSIVGIFTATDALHMLRALVQLGFRDREDDGFEALPAFAH
jgi:CBS domain-containing protein